MMPRPAADETKARALRPRLRPGTATMIADSKVGHLLTLLDRSGVPQQLEELLAGRPGPPGVRPRTVLAGLLLACYFSGRATIAEAWRILHFRLHPKARGWLDIPPQPPVTARHCIASSRRLYRGFDRITTVLDPARCNRRARLPQDLADAHANAWSVPSGRAAAERLDRLANQLVLTPVRLAQVRGHLRGWRGDLGVDATPIPVLARPGSDRTGTASVEITAGWHYSGGSDHGVFGYSASILVAAHRRRLEEAPGKSTPYPQLCLGLVLDTPTVRTGPNAISALTQLHDLALPTGLLAADRAYTNCSPENFQIPARRLGYQLAMDYKVEDRGLQGSYKGALLVDGSLACPMTPRALVQATAGAGDETVRRRPDELQQAIDERIAYFLKTKQGLDHRGAIRLHCPAAGPSPSVNCPRRDRLRPRTARGAPPVAVLNLADRRQRAAHPAARPTVQLPDDEWLHPPSKHELPLVCGNSDITIPAHADGDLKTAKFRQDSHYLTAPWTGSYKPIRSHNEGINGRLKGDELDIGNPKHRPAPGQVAQTLLIALMITAGNLNILETWLYQRTGSELSDTDYAAIPPATPLSGDLPAPNGRPPPRRP